MMNRCKTILIIVFFSATQSCHNSPTEFATKWSHDIKQKIIEDAFRQYDKRILDTPANSLTFFKGGKILRRYHLIPVFDKKGKLISFVTAASTFFSTDQNFELIRELCPVDSRNFEGIRYKGIHLGYALFSYCNGKIQEAGFRYNGDIGVWKRYDSTGAVIKETDNGHTEILERLKNIKYAR
jgi:hypothetical protein